MSVCVESYYFQTVLHHITFYTHVNSSRDEINILMGFIIQLFSDTLNQLYSDHFASYLRLLKQMEKIVYYAM